MDRGGMRSLPLSLRSTDHGKAGICAMNAQTVTSHAATDLSFIQRHSFFAPTGCEMCLNGHGRRLRLPRLHGP